MTLTQRHPAHGWHSEAERNHADGQAGSEGVGRQRPALNLLRGTVGTRPVIVAGHSEGAVVASLLAAGPASSGIDGIVSLSGPALPILSILRAQVAAMSPPGVTPDMTLFDRTAAAIRASQALPDEATSNPQTAMLSSMPEPTLAYLRGADRVDPVAALAQVKTPVLIVQGGRDDSVPADHAGMLRVGRTTLPTEVAMFPGLTHFYKIASPDLRPMQSMGLETRNDPAVADGITARASHLGR